MPDAADAVARLRAGWRLDFARVRPVLAGLAGGATIGELVAASGLPRRDVEAVLAELAPYSEPDGDRVVLPGFAVPERRPRPPEADLTDRMAELAAGRPPSRWRLDHVPATAQTMARRALYLADRYDLDGAAVLCLGDHDLTALAVGCTGAGAELAVVDIDEPILDHIAGSGVWCGT
jgi:N4-bis(aminopropyl)spermidine synthase